MAKAAEVLEKVVPQGKVFWWIVGAASVIFMSGFGTALRFGEFRNLPKELASMDTAHIAKMDSIDMRMATLRSVSDANTASIAAVRLEIASAMASQQRVLCLFELTVRGIDLTPLEADRRCQMQGVLRE